MQFTSFSIRATMVSFWIALIVIFLCLPFLSQLVTTEKSINIMSWTELIDPLIIEQFEKETGIKVNVSYIEGNEELYTRIKATGGAGYDLLVPSDYALPWLLQDDLLKPLDTTKLTMLDQLDPRLLDHYFDPQNVYSLPFNWQLYGLAVDTNEFNNNIPAATWGLLFDKSLVSGYVVMPDVAREVVLLAGLYLFGTTEDLDEAQLRSIKELLLTQKKWVAAYSEMRADFLLISGVCSTIVSQSTLMWRVTREHEQIQFIVPKEGTFVVIDNFVLPKQSAKDDYVYQFINFLYKPSIMKHHFEVYRFFPATNDLTDLMNEVPGGQSVKTALSQLTHNLHFFKNTVSEQKIKDIWVALKGL